MTASFRFAAALAVLVVVAGCAPRQFQLEFPEDGLVDALTVTVEDRTGLVLDVGAAPSGDDWRGGVANPPGRTDQLVIAWLGGMCDRHALLTLERAGAAFRITERTERPASCLLAGIGRAIVLQLAAPIAAETVAFDPALGRPDDG